MKTYSFSVEADYTHTGKEFINSILNEIESEKNQLELTYRINAETTAMHRKILADLCDELNATLVPIGLKFDRICTIEVGMNHYFGHKAICTFPNGESWVILISAHNDHSFKDSKYSTYTGEYFFRAGHICKPNHMDVFSGSFGSSFKTIDQLLNSMRNSIKTMFLTQR